MWECIYVGCYIDIDFMNVELSVVCCVMDVIGRCEIDVVVDIFFLNCC